jgi:cytochrome P450
MLRSLASTERTTAALTYALYFLFTHPQTLATVRAELDGTRSLTNHGRSRVRQASLPHFRSESKCVGRIPSFHLRSLRSPSLEADRFLRSTSTL